MIEQQEEVKVDEPEEEELMQEVELQDQEIDNREGLVQEA